MKVLGTAKKQCGSHTELMKLEGAIDNRQKKSV